MLFQVVDCQLCVRLDVRANIFSQYGMLLSYYCRVENPRNLLEHALDLGRRDVDAAAPDDVLFAVHEAQNGIRCGTGDTKGNGGESVSKGLELPAEVKKRLRKLRILSEKAEAGKKGARQELRRAIRNSTPEVVAKASDIAKKGQQMLIGTAAAGDPLMEEAHAARLDVMRAEIAGEDPTLLEVLLTERVGSCWLLVELLEALTSARLQTGEHMKDKRVQPSFLRFILKWQESAQRRYLSAIRELARVRKLQSGTPRVQYNTQFNLRSE
jgi:hypothetical protein